MNRYNVEITDLFCGELNYSYVTRVAVTANSVHGALCKLARDTGLNFRYQFGHVWDRGAIYHSTSKLTGLVIEEAGE